jgi:leader peptidase (prepilin peptidase)/N-methyltransferase
VALCVGSAIGGFTSREPADRAVWWRGRSACGTCGTTLGAFDLVPIASWIALRGRCRHCGAPIPLWYPAVEATALAIALVAFALLPTPLAWLAAVLGWWLLLLALIDLRELILPDALTVPLIVVGVLLSATLPGPAPSLRDSLLGAAAGFGALALVAWAYRVLRHREGLGLGDAKLFAAGGAWLGVMRLPELLLLAAMLGIAHALAAGAWRRPDKLVPFGPALALAFWLVWLAAALSLGPSNA